MLIELISLMFLFHIYYAMLWLKNNDMLPEDELKDMLPDLDALKGMFGQTSADE